MPAVPPAGVPLSVAVPLPLSTNVTPLGSAPVRVSVGVGTPLVVTVKLPALPTDERGGVSTGDRRRLIDREREAWLADEPTPLLAVIVSG